MSVLPSPELFPGGGVFPGRSPEPALGTEPELTVGRRAFATAQRLFSGAPIDSPRSLAVGWHDSSVSAEDGSFAVVSAAYEELVGEIVSVTFGVRRVFAYVLQSADVPVDVSVTRRLFLALNRLTIEALPAQVTPVA